MEKLSLIWRKHQGVIGIDRKKLLLPLTGVFIVSLFFTLAEAQNYRPFRPPLGFFNWLRSANGDVDLKKGGIGPIVERLRVAAMSGAVLSPATAQDLAEIFPFLLRLRLRAQLAARKKHQMPTNSVNLAEISTLERRHLKEAFIVIKQVQEDLRAQWRLDRLG
jgi:CBS domain-containing protein